jgi:hypothetical protein
MLPFNVVQAAKFPRAQATHPGPGTVPRNQHNRFRNFAAPHLVLVVAGFRRQFECRVCTGRMRSRLAFRSAFEARASHLPALPRPQQCPWFWLRSKGILGEGLGRRTPELLGIEIEPTCQNRHVEGACRSQGARGGARRPRRGQQDASRRVRRQGLGRQLTLTPTRDPADNGRNVPKRPLLL